MDILLGIFCNPTFKRYYENNEEVCIFPFVKLCRENSNSSVLDVVMNASELANKIHFVLDGIKLPLNCNLSITCLELISILSEDLYLTKIQFWSYGKKVSTSLVVKLVQQSGHGYYHNMEFNQALKKLKKSIKI